MSCTLKVTVILLVFSASYSASLRAQTNGISDPPTVASIVNLDGVHRGATMKVKTAGKTSEGKVSGIRGDSLWLSSNGSRIGISIQTVDSAWTRERQIAKGAAIGAVTGGLLFGALLAAAANGMCDIPKCDSSESIGAGLLGGIVGAAYGSVIGAGAGLLVKRWKRWVP
jgi:hypothetical protein